MSNGDVEIPCRDGALLTLSPIQGARLRLSAWGKAGALVMIDLSAMEVMTLTQELVEWLGAQADES